MSEIKPEVEYVIKTGRQVVEHKQVNFPDKLSAQIDAIKQQYNDLGAQVCSVFLGLLLLCQLAKPLIHYQSLIVLSILSWSGSFLITHPCQSQNASSQISLFAGSCF